LDSPEMKQYLDILSSRFEMLQRASSGSWLGYHASVYYKNFKEPPPGDNFSVEFGLMEFPYGRTSGNWSETSFSEVKTFLYNGLDENLTKLLDDLSSNAKELYDNLKMRVLVTLTAINKLDNSFLKEEYTTEIDDIEIYHPSQYYVNLYTRHNHVSRDQHAVSQGICVPHHIALYAKYLSDKSPFNALKKLIQICNKILFEFEMVYSDGEDNENGGNGIMKKIVFIGHGGSKDWRELKDFISDRLHLEWEEFNRGSAAGIPTIERLSAMLNQSCFAFIVMTAEDEHADSTKHARENVIHEAGLFQGRLSFSKAIILLEIGCNEFSNIHGLGQIRFESGKISSKFEEVREVLEREGII